MKKTIQTNMNNSKKTDMRKLELVLSNFTRDEKTKEKKLYKDMEEIIKDYCSQIEHGKRMNVMINVMENHIYQRMIFFMNNAEDTTDMIIPYKTKFKKQCSSLTFCDRCGNIYDNQRYDYYGDMLRGEFDGWTDCVCGYTYSGECISYYDRNEYADDWEHDGGEMEKYMYQVEYVRKYGYCGGDKNDD